MKFSIIVPVYNSEDTIVRCVESLLNQETEKPEIILVDDHSEDDSYSVCKKLAEAYTNIVLLKADGKGVSAARNTGLANAVGDYIGFCDADDIYAPNMLHRVSEFFAGNPDLQMVITGYFYSAVIDGRVKPVEIVRFKKARSCTAEMLFEPIVTDRRALGSVCNKFYKKSAVCGCLFHPGLTHCEDMHFNIQVLLRNREAYCAIIPKPLYHYIHTENSATNRVDKLFDDDGECNYVTAMDAISCLPEISTKGREILRYNTAKLSIDTLWNFSIDTHKREKLVQRIAENKKQFFKIAMNNMCKGDCKVLIKYFLLKWR